jgi:hypothetical protein
VNEGSLPPVAIRITRPYTTEDEFLEQELETLSRSTVTLLGAQPRPQGVVLRFELVLSSGSVLMRGEGRVVGFRPNAHRGLGGLTLRFTRLDSRSKALVDRAATVREQRRLATAAVGEAPVMPPTTQASEPGPFSVRSGAGLVSERPPELEATSADPPSGERPVPPPVPPMKAADVPAGREEVLARLRTRGQGLEASAVQRILEQRKPLA